MNTRKVLIITSLLIGLSPAMVVQGGYIFANLNFPGAVSTYAAGIEGDKVVGGYFDGSAYHGFLYADGSFTTLDFPGATSTGASGISSTNIVGTYTDQSGVTHGFLYNAAGFVTLDPPSSSYTAANGISGTNVVGYYYIGSTDFGFVYDIVSGTYQTIHGPFGISSANVYGVSGDKLVGVYKDGSNQHGFVYYLTNDTYTILNDPLASSENGGTYGLCISGNLAGGFYYDGSSKINGYIYDLTTASFTTMNFTNNDATQIWGIDGANIIGDYNNNDGDVLSFVATPPPQLTLTPAGTNVILTWPGIVLNFKLQATTNLLASTCWNTNLPAPIILCGAHTVTNPVSASHMFFRLSQ